VPSIAEQTAGNIATAQAQATINNPNMVNQYGSTTYSPGEDVFDQAGYDTAMSDWNTVQAQFRSQIAGMPEYVRNELQSQFNAQTAGRGPTKEKYTTLGRQTMTQTLSPEEQAIFSANQGNRLGLNNLARTGIDKAQGVIGQNLDFSGAPAAPGSSDEVRKKVMEAMMSRSDPALSRANQQQDADLIAAGIRPGTEAWDRVKGEQGRNRNDMLMQAEIAGGNAAQQEFGMGTDARKNYISELLAQRSVPLNEITALMSGSQVSNPFAGQGYQGGAVKPTDYFSGANMLNQYNQDIYNQGVGSQNALIGAGATLGAAALRFSDRRLKTKINRIGTHKLGIGLYTWEYIKKAPKGMEKLANWGGSSIGVMADELKKVMPQAVIRIGDYDAVDYAMIGA
jgi:hypothetical protein